VALTIVCIPKILKRKALISALKGDQSHRKEVFLT
jgi:hypothetical protein